MIVIVLQSGSPAPSAQYGHTACLLGKNAYIFGGKSETHVVDNLFRLDLGKVDHIRGVYLFCLQPVPVFVCTCVCVCV